MRWIKHLTATREDEKIARLIDEAGAAGYGIWWMVLETVARQIQNGDRKCSVTYPVSKWATELSLRGSHVRHWLSKLAVTGLVSVEWNESDVTVTIPNLLKYRDEWQSRLGSRSGARIQKQNTESEAEASSDSEEQNPQKPRTAGKPADAPSGERFAFQGQELRVTERQHKAMGDAFPWVDLAAEYRKADAWLVANPDRHIRRFSQFIHNWMGKVPKAGATGGNGNGRSAGNKAAVAEAVRRAEARDRAAVVCAERGDGRAAE